MKALKYDQRTLNKVYGELRIKKETLKRQSFGFLKESERYLEIGDEKNHQNASDVSWGLYMASVEVDELIYTIKKNFKNRTNATKRIKK